MLIHVQRHTIENIRIEKILTEGELVKDVLHFRNRSRENGL